VGGLVVEYYRQ